MLGMGPAAPLVASYGQHAITSAMRVMTFFPLTRSINSVTPDKAMSFSTMNGEIDVTLPANTKANVKLKTDHGDIFTDFDIKLDATARPPQVEDNRKNGGRYRVQFDRGTNGTINGGGPEIQFTTFNGNILIHKK
jgi:DUF4097 and DUF4098 domain-containing protein YvlB